MIHLGFLFFVFLIIFLVNFPFGTWYTGWDNLHPEFNFCMNFWRALNAVWQTNQGTGTYGGHGYAATLFHTLFLWVLSIIIPLQYLRSLFTFFTLFVGGIGVFFLLRKILLELTTSTRHTSSHSSLYKEENNQYYTPLQKNEIVPIEKSRIHDSTIGTSSHNPRNDSLIDTASLLAALYYMLNLATVQNFYIQLEAFIVHFAALPWLFFTLFVFLKNKTKKNLLIFAVVNLVASVQGFIPPLFFVYMILS